MPFFSFPTQVILPRFDAITVTAQLGVPKCVDYASIVKMKRERRIRAERERIVEIVHGCMNQNSKMSSDVRLCVL